VSIHYTIRHLTKFRYDVAVSESVIECRMRPASEALQRCLHFDLDVVPGARVFAHRDFHGNWVHHFNLPRAHTELVVTARAQVELDAPPSLPASLDNNAWATIDGWAASGEQWDSLQPSQFAVWSPTLLEFERSIPGTDARPSDPLIVVRDSLSTIHRSFTYMPDSTSVDSPIDAALASKQGVCQDFAHIMLAVLRRRGLPCRYVSGYIAPSHDKSAADSTNATHAWVEVLLPTLGWVGVDPTHNIEAGIRHIRVAIGRDYADVPPTRGTFKGGSAGALSVAVTIQSGDRSPADGGRELWTTWPATAPESTVAAQAQQQQQ